MRKLMPVAAVISLILLLPLFFLVVGILQAPWYTQTYYGELPAMVEKLQNTENRKIVVLGNSAVAFGVNSRQMEQELRTDGLEYSVCNFGLYGVIGTKAMLDLALPELRQGDLVVFVPEQTRQALSLDFSGVEMWRAIDGNFSLFFRIAKENRGQMIAGFPSFVADKYAYRKQGTEFVPSGIYSRDSFNENCDMVYDRPHNIMKDGYDPNNRVSFDPAIWQTDFIDYLNEFAEAAAKKGAEVCFAWCPVNSASLVQDSDEAAIAAYYDFIDEKLMIPVISNPHNYLLEREWFYDSNFHMNSAGSVLYTYLLTDDIKSFLGDTEQSSVLLPEKPEMPAAQDIFEGDNSCENCFIYEKNDTGWVIAALTEEGQRTSDLVLPVTHNGEPVTDYSEEIFRSSTVLESIVFQKNIRLLYDDSFSGCKKLKIIELKQTSAAAVSVGFGLLNGTDQAYIRVPQESIAEYLNDYFWGHYAGHYETY